MRVSALLLAALAGCSSGRAGETPRYVGRSVCATCHTEEDRAFAASDHDRSMAVASEGTVLGRFPDSLVSGGRRTTFHRDQGAFRVQVMEGGPPADYRVEFAIGIHPVQQYLVAFPDGRLQRLSQTWDSRPVAAGGQRWFDLHGEEVIGAGDPRHWTRLGGRWNAMCAECHVTGLERNYDAADGGYATTWAEINVSCEACHGPGSSHVAWANEPPASRDTIARGLTARISAGRSRPGQLDACAPCHAYRTRLRQEPAGGRFGDTHSLRLLEQDLYFADGQAREEVFVYGSFLQSSMARAGLVCSDCHDPHSTRLKAEGDGACTSCHAPARYATATHHHHSTGSPGSHCVDCHMPQRTFMAVDTRRDHVFSIPRPDISAVVGSPDPCTSCHADRTQGWASRILREWTGHPPAPHFGPAIAEARRGDPSGRAPLLALTKDTGTADIVRATAVSLLPRYGGSAERQAVARALQDGDWMVRAAAVRTWSALEGMDPGLLLPLLEDSLRAVRIEAARALVPHAAQLGPQLAARVEPVEAEWLAAQMVTADLPSTQASLGAYYRDRGDLDAAVAAFRRASRMEPALPAPYLALAELYRTTGRPQEMIEVLAEGVAASPDAPALHRTMGLALATTGQRGRALEHLETAARLAPADPTMVMTWAIGLNDTGRSADAISVLRRLWDQQPWNAQALVLLVTMLRDQDSLPSARRLAVDLVRRWPGVPAYERVARELAGDPGERRIP